METPEYDLGRVLSIDAEAIGEPGRRRFRLITRSSVYAVGIWMEKEQLAGIGAWFDEMLRRLEEERPSGEPDAGPLPFEGALDVEFQAGRIGLGYVEEEDVFALQAFDVESDREDRPTLHCFLSRGQCRVLCRKIDEVIAAGRPICPLCGQPMDLTGHACPRTNGHQAGTHP